MLTSCCATCVMIFVRPQGNCNAAPFTPTSQLSTSGRETFWCRQLLAALHFSRVCEPLTAPCLCVVFPEGGVYSYTQDSQLDHAAIRKVYNVIAHGYTDGQILVGDFNINSAGHGDNKSRVAVAEIGAETNYQPLPVDAAPVPSPTKNTVAIQGYGDDDVVDAPGYGADEGEMHDGEVDDSQYTANETSPSAAYSTTSLSQRYATPTAKHHRMINARD